jgi:hypothetical protein
VELGKKCTRCEAVYGRKILTDSIKFHLESPQSIAFEKEEQHTPKSLAQHHDIYPA